MVSRPNWTGYKKHFLMYNFNNAVVRLVLADLSLCVFLCVCASHKRELVFVPLDILIKQTLNIKKKTYNVFVVPNSDIYTCYQI